MLLIKPYLKTNLIQNSPILKLLSHVKDTGIQEEQTPKNKKNKANQYFLPLRDFLVHKSGMN